MKQNPGILSHQIDDEFVLYDSQKDAVHTLNATAQIIWENRHLSPEDIAQKLQTAYQVPYDIAFQDVQSILQKFKMLGMAHESH